MAAYPPIPCGDADFRRIRLTGSLYVDKTRFLRKLERVRFAVLIRPRRFGKSCWISLLEHHYDRTRADAFDAVFRGTDVAREPTDERHRYVVLRFNFSAFNDALESLERNFEDYCADVVEHALGRHPHLRRGYLIELKYVRRSDPLDADRLDEAARAGGRQLRRYLADDRLARQYPAVRFIGLSLVFHGWELVRCDAVETPRTGDRRRSRRAGSPILALNHS